MVYAVVQHTSISQMEMEIGKSLVVLRFVVAMTGHPCRRGKAHQKKDLTSRPSGGSMHARRRPVTTERPQTEEKKEAQTTRT